MLLTTEVLLFRGLAGRASAALPMIRLVVWAYPCIDRITKTWAGVSWVAGGAGALAADLHQRGDGNDDASAITNASASTWTYDILMD